MVSQDLKEGGKHRFTFPELDKEITIRNLKADLPRDLKSGSPPTPNQAVKNMIKFSDEARAKYTTDHEPYLKEIREKYHFKDPNAPKNWVYEYKNSGFTAGKSLEDYMNVIVINRPIKYKGKTFGCFRDVHLHE
jgi:hypothetical protein